MRRTSTLLLILTLSVVHLVGQEDIPMKDSMDVEEVFISATRASKSDPITFQNISVRKIEKIYSGQDPAVLLQQLSPSIVSYSDAGTDIGNYAQFRMRGMSQSRINVTLNGVPLNDMLDQGVFFSNFSDFGNSVESIQVQRGVGSSSVGVASYGGAINFESTNVFKGDASTELQLTTGSFGTLRTSAEIKTGRMKNNIGAYGRVSRTTVDGYKTHSGSDSYSIFGSVGWAGDRDVLKLTGFMGKTQNDQSYLPVLLSDIQADPQTNYNHPNDTDDFEQELIQLQWNRSLTEDTRLDATLYYGGARGVFPFGIDDETQFVFGLTNDHYGFLSNFTYEASNISFKAGLQAYKFDRTNFEYVAPNVSNPYDRDSSSKSEVSAYGKANYNIGDLSFYGDIQFRSVGINLRPDEELGTGLDLSESWFFINPVIGLNYNINDNSQAYLSIGRSGREPTRSDIRNGVTQEEYATDLELGWKYNDKRWAVGANLFHMKFDDEISSVGALQAQSYMEIRQNVADSRRSGLELQLGYQSSDALGFSLNGAYMTTNVSEFNNGSETFTDVEHIFAPKLILRPQLEYKLSNTLEFILSGRYVSSSFMELANIPSFNLPAHTVLNAQVNVAITSNANMKIMLNNLTDEQYFTDGAPVDLDFDGIVEGPGFRIQPPRHIYVMFTLKL